MTNRWLSAVVLAVALGVSACGGPVDETTMTEQDSQVEAQLPMCGVGGTCPTGYYCSGSTCRPCLYSASTPEGVTAAACPAYAVKAGQDGQVQQMLPMCDDQGRCPSGYYCDGGPFGTCRRGIVEY